MTDPERAPRTFVYAAAAEDGVIDGYEMDRVKQ